MIPPFSQYLLDDKFKRISNNRSCTIFQNCNKRTLAIHLRQTQYRPELCVPAYMHAVTVLPQDLISTFSHKCTVYTMRQRILRLLLNRRILPAAEMRNAIFSRNTPARFQPKMKTLTINPPTLHTNESTLESERRRAGVLFFFHFRKKQKAPDEVFLLAFGLRSLAG